MTRRDKAEMVSGQFLQTSPYHFAQLSLVCFPANLCPHHQGFGHCKVVINGSRNALTIVDFYAIYCGEISIFMTQNPKFLGPKWPKYINCVLGELPIFHHFSRLKSQFLWLEVPFIACRPRRDTTMTPNTASNSLDSSKGCWALDWEGFQRETTGNFEEIMVIFTKPNICERTSWENWNKAWDPGKAQNAQLISYSHLFCHVWGSILTSQVGCTSVDWSHALETLMGVFGNIEQPTCVGVGLCDIGV